MLYLISYDLNKEDKNYPALWEALRRDGAIKILYSEWLVRLTGTALDAANRYLAYMDTNDSIFVTEVTNNTAWRGLQNEPHSTSALQTNVRRVA